MRVICPNCGEALDNDKLAFCVMCGASLKASPKQKGFFAKSSQTGTSRAEEIVAAASTRPRKSTASQTSTQTEKQPRVAAQQNSQTVQSEPAMQQRVMPQNPAMQQGAMSQNPVMQQGAMPQNPVMQQGAMPQNPVMQQGAMPQNPVMQQGAMPQNPAMQQGAMPQNPMMQNMAPQQSQMGMPQQGQMMGMMQPQMGMQMSGNAEQPVVQGQQMMGMQGMMNPQMMGMHQMQYGMPQFMGYDPNGMPIYMQMVPQMVGYDAYGNPMYTMVPMQSYGMPQMNGMMSPQMQPMNGMQSMPQQQTVQPMPQQSMPQQQTVQPMPQMAPPPPTPQQPVQQTEQPMQTMQVSSPDEMPVSAESLMDADENEPERAAAPEIPNEDALLEQIFSDKPKEYQMSSGTKPGAQTFSIRLSASEIIDVAEEKPVQTAPKPRTSKKTERSSAPTADGSKAEVDAATAAAAPKKPKPVSPEDFFGDEAKARKKQMAVVQNVGNLNDAELEKQLAVMESATKKKSRRSMQAADKDVDPQAVVNDPQVGAAAQALLADPTPQVDIRAQKRAESEAAAAEARTILHTMQPTTPNN
jgi:hypothetical protein